MLQVQGHQVTGARHASELLTAAPEGPLTLVVTRSHGKHFDPIVRYTMVKAAPDAPWPIGLSPSGDSWVAPVVHSVHVTSTRASPEVGDRVCHHGSDWRPGQQMPMRRSDRSPARPRVTAFASNPRTS